MKHCKALFLLLTFLVVSSIIINISTKEAIYTRSQVDSIVAELIKQIDDRLQTKVDTLTKAEVAKLVTDNELLDLKIKEAANEKLDILQSEHDALISQHLTIIGLVITLLTAIVGILVPLYYNRQNEQRLKKAEKAAKEAKASQLFAQAVNDIYNMPEAIIDLYSQAIELKSDYADAYNNRGLLKYNLKNFDGALADYNKAIELKPDFSEAYNNRGLLKFTMKDIDGAIDDYKEAIRLKPNFTVAYNNRGILKKEKGDQDGALADYAKAKELKPDYADVYLNRGTLKNDMGDKEGALSDYNRAIRLKPNDAVMYYNRGELKYDMGDHDGALKDYEEAIELNPNFAKAYNNRAYTLLKSAKSNETDTLQIALQDVNIAIKLDGNNFNFYETKGEIYLVLNEYYAAITSFKQAINLNGKDIDSYKYRAICYRKLAEEEQDAGKKKYLIAKAEEDENTVEELQ